MTNAYDKKDILDILSNLYNNLPQKGYSNLRESILESANKIIKDENPLPIINMLITTLTNIIISNISNEIPPIIETSNVSLKHMVKKYNKGLWLNDYTNLFGSNNF